MRWPVPLLVVVLGVAVFIVGGADDSPGLQGIGAALVGGAILLGLRAARRNRRR
ncbi:hypothetical protein ACFVYC_09140 [Pseudarthrobacter sp. NPDC058329]|uniref:hypothetical protein n=1 Tax=Pseudarthrobacter sp. NPDC058329 TaxID=3346448 RepID=UPI0036D95250